MDNSPFLGADLAPPPITPVHAPEVFSPFGASKPQGAGDGAQGKGSDGKDADADARFLEDLQSLMRDCFSGLLARIQTIEANITHVHAILDKRAPQLAGNAVAAPVAAPTKPAPTPLLTRSCGLEGVEGAEGVKAEPDGAVKFELVLENVTSQWFTERAFPPFTIKAIDVATHEVHTEATDWLVEIHLVDGYGRSATEKLGFERARTQVLIDGQAEVSGLRFKQVSSKNGMHFNLACVVVGPAAVARHVRRAVSDDIVVMSCRLFTSRKSAFAGVCDTHPVSKIPGIGKKYGQPLSKLGIRTIADLAALPTKESEKQHNPEGGKRLDDVLEFLKNDKGPLGEAKFVEHIHTARSIQLGHYTNAPQPGTGGSTAGASGKAKDAVSRKRKAGPPPGASKQGAVGGEAHEGKRARQDDDAPLSFGRDGLALGELDGLGAKAELVVGDDDGGVSKAFVVEDSKVWDDEQDLDVVSSFLATSPIAPAATPPCFPTPSTSLAPFFDAMPLLSSPPSPLHRDVVGGKGGGCVQPSLPSPAALFPPSSAPSPLKDLHAAAWGGDVDKCKAAIAAARASNLVLERAGSSHPTALMAACARGSVGVVRFLCALPEVDLNCANRQGWRALHFAVMLGGAECLQALVQAANERAGKMRQAKERLRSLIKQQRASSEAVGEEGEGMDDDGHNDDDDVEIEEDDEEDEDDDDELDLGARVNANWTPIAMAVASAQPEATTTLVRATQQQELGRGGTETGKGLGVMWAQREGASGLSLLELAALTGSVGTMRCVWDEVVRREGEGNGEGKRSRLEWLAGRVGKARAERLVCCAREGGKEEVEAWLCAK